MIQPAREGSEVIAGGSIDDIVRLMQAGIPASEAVLPKTCEFIEKHGIHARATTKRESATCPNGSSEDGHDLSGFQVPKSAIRPRTQALRLLGAKPRRSLPT